MVPILYKQLLNGVVWNIDKKKKYLSVFCVMQLFSLGIVFIRSTPAEPTDAEFIVNYLHSFK